MKLGIVHIFLFISFVYGRIKDDEGMIANKINQRLSDEKTVHNEFLFCSKPIYENIFKELVKVLRTDLDTLRFLNMSFAWVKLPYNAFKDNFYIKFIPVRFSNVHSSRFLLFIELRRTIIELILLLDDNLTSNTNSLKHNSIFYDSLYASLIGLYDILFTKNNLNEHLNPEYHFVPINKTNFMEFSASETLNNMFYPKQFIPKYSKTLKTFLNQMEKNTEKNPFLMKGFHRYDLVRVKVKKQTKIYRAKYYFLGAILQNLFF
ncbi:hypothetical protein NGRA_2997 [Nosema granulosis]|uniref:Uncharacterized protein n=1 Tax=Nosema granulosis TaxID=83296 RepID=A0A9P6KX65_9MICR|nr:hypothetical protein NGRA_2997 [Nosema granulosis]